MERGGEAGGGLCLFYNHFCAAFATNLRSQTVIPEIDCTGFLGLSG